METLIILEFVANYVQSLNKKCINILNNSAYKNEDESFNENLNIKERIQRVRESF